MGSMPDNDRNARRPEGAGPSVMRPRVTPWLLIALLVAGLVLFNGWFSNAARDPVTFSQYRELVAEGKLEGTTVTISDSSISGEYRDDQGEMTPFSTKLTAGFEPNSEVDFLESQEGVEVEMATPSPWFGLVASLLPILLLMGLAYYFLFRRMGASGAGNPSVSAVSRMRTPAAAVDTR